MTKKRRRKSVDRENLSPLAKLKLNQQIKSTERLLSDDELKALKLSMEGGNYSPRD